MKSPAPERLAWAAYAWLAVFFLAPLAILARLSLSETVIAVPPFGPRLDLSQRWTGLRVFLAGLDFDAYRRLFADPVYLRAYGSSLGYATGATAILLVVGYPMALAMARAPRRWRPLLLGAVALPFWTSFLIRIAALRSLLQAVGLADTDAAVWLGLAYAYLPFMVLPLYAVLEREDPALREAAADLGAGPWRAFWTVTLPLSAPGVAAGALLCLIPMVGEFVIPDLLGGAGTLMLGKLIWTEFFSNRDWPTAAAAALVLVATLAVPILLHRRLEERWR